MRGGGEGRGRGAEFCCSCEECGDDGDVFTLEARLNTPRHPLTEQAIQLTVSALRITQRNFQPSTEHSSREQETRRRKEQ